MAGDLAAADAGATGPSAAVERRLTGQARPAKTALKEYEEFNAERRKHLGDKPALWPLLAPDPEKMFWWRMQLDCGCVRETLTWGDKTPPHDRRYPDYANNAWLPKGQVLCLHDDASPSPYMSIAELGARHEITFPADPPKLPPWATPEVWAVMRHTEPHTSAFWTVTLTCGHVTEVCTEVEWKPEDGPRLVPAARLAEMIAEDNAYWESRPPDEDRQEREHTRRMLDQGFPIPAPEQTCFTCRHARHIVAYQRIGWLVPRAAEAPSAAVTAASREDLARRLKRAETQAAGLRHQLAELDQSL